MGLKILKYKDGTPRPTWWARYCVKGKYHDTDLRVRIDGKIPRDRDGNISLTIKGDAAFEKSRAAAQRAFAKLGKIRTESTDEIRASVHKARTGESIDGIPLSGLFARWCGKKRQRAVSPGWRDMMRIWFDRFAVFAGSYARNHGTVCDSINDITPEIAGAWFEDIKSKYAWETVTKMMKLMRGAFADYGAKDRANPFGDIILRGGGADGNGTVSRKPLNDDELNRLFEIAADDDFAYSLIVTAACTGMRIGDVCTLKWCDVDLKDGLIECVTAKAGVRVVIPIFERLRAVLKSRDAIPHDGKQPDAFVFPVAADMYTPKPKLDANGKIVKDKHGNIKMTDSRDAIYKRVQPYFARAVFGDVPADDAVAVDKQIAPRAFDDVIADAGFADGKRERIIEVYHRNKAGESNIAIARALNIPRSQVCTDLRDAEKLTGETLRPWAKANTLKNLVDRTRQIRTDRKGKRICKRAASIYGWHSLRHTFVVMALMAGVPVEDVRKIVGHGECETTIANYYNPTKEHAAARIRAQMVNTAIGGGKQNRTVAITPAKLSVDDIIAGLSASQKKALAKRLLGL